MKICFRWVQLVRRLEKTTKFIGTFLSEKGMTICVYNFMLEAWNESGKVGFNTVAIDIHFMTFDV